jgi:hypothetical protein
MYSELDAVLALDYEISVGVVVFRMEGAFWQSHRKLSIVLVVRVEKENAMTRVVSTFWSSRKRMVNGVSHTAPCSSPKAGKRASSLVLPVQRRAYSFGSEEP